LDYFIKPPYGNALSLTGQGMLIAEVARGDAGCGTMMVVHAGLVTYSIQTLGSE
jgi:hypothetical protein